MSVYRPLPTGKLVSSIKPKNRRLLLWVLNWYDAVSAVVIFCIMLLAIMPILPHYPIFVAWPLVYVVYIICKLVSFKSIVALLSMFMKRTANILPHFLKRCFQQQKACTFWAFRAGQNRTVQQGPESRVPQRILAILLVLVAAIIVVSIHLADLVLSLPMGDSTIWLLFGPPIWMIARNDSLKWILSISILAFTINALTHLIPVTLSIESIRIISLQSLWLILGGLLPIILLSYLAERESGLNKAIDVLEQIARIRSSSSQDFANEATRAISSTLGFSEVNILLATSQSGSSGQGLLLIGGASETSRRLAKEKYFIPPNTGTNSGITTWAAFHKKYCIVNDVLKDPQHRYLRHEDFPNTRAELAVCIMIGSELIGVLDIQSEIRYAFSKDDVNLLRAITTHLAVALSNVQNLTRVKGLYTISQTITKRLLSQQELRPVLKEIVTVAREVLLADVVILYPHNPENKLIGDPVVDGLLRSYAASAEEVRYPGRSVVTQAIEAGELKFNSYIQENSDPTIDFNPSANDYNNFVKREGIQSAAILPLSVGPRHKESRTTDAVLGVMFVNYHKEMFFTAEYKDWCTTLADLAALTLQNAFLHDRVIKEERTNLRGEIHDGLTQDANSTRMLLEQMVDTFNTTGSVHGTKLEIALRSCQSLTKQVNYLVESWRDSANQCGLFSEIEGYAELVQETLGVVCTCSPSGSDYSILPTIQHEVHMVTREAVYNAVRHGNASSICIRLHCDNALLNVIITDNGKGFDTTKVSDPHGLNNMYYRIGRMGGTIKIDSALNSGTTITADIPLL